VPRAIPAGDAPGAKRENTGLDLAMSAGRVRLLLLSLHSTFADVHARATKRAWAGTAGRNGQT
jgi:hypothetical protein